MAAEDTSKDELAAQAARQSERQDRLIAFLHEKWGRGDPDKPVPCPYCGVDEWYVDPVPVLLPRVNGPFGVGLPSFVLQCTNCGNQVFINASVAGLFDVLAEVDPEETTTRVGTSEEEPEPKVEAEPDPEAAEDS